MATRQTSFHCQQCNQARLFTSTNGVNHVLHLLISIFLCGLWLPFWILFALTDSPRFHCSQCGYSDATRYLANPNLRQTEQAAARNRHLASEKRKQKIFARLETFPIYKWAANSRNIWKVILGTVILVGVGSAIIISLIGFQASPPANVNISQPSPKPIPEDLATTNKLKRDMAGNYSKTTWYSEIQTLSAKPSRVAIFTALLSADEKARKICAGVSSLYYGYSKTNQNDTITVYGKGSKVLIEREGIAEKCE